MDDEDVKKKHKKKKAKKKKDPKRPKRGSSAYNLFYNEIKKEVAKNHPDKKMIDQSKIIAEKWKALSPKEKDVYERQSSALREIQKKKQIDYDAYKLFKEQESGKIVIRMPEEDPTWNSLNEESKKPFVDAVQKKKRKKPIVPPNVQTNEKK